MRRSAIFYRKAGSVRLNISYGKATGAKLEA